TSTTSKAIGTDARSGWATSPSEEVIVGFTGMTRIPTSCVISGIRYAGRSDLDSSTIPNTATVRASRTMAASCASSVISTAELMMLQSYAPHSRRTSAVVGCAHDARGGVPWGGGASRRIPAGAQRDREREPAAVGRRIGRHHDHGHDPPVDSALPPD